MTITLRLPFPRADNRTRGRNDLLPHGVTARITSRSGAVPARGKPKFSVDRSPTKFASLPRKSKRRRHAPPHTKPIAALARSSRAPSFNPASIEVRLPRRAENYAADLTEASRFPKGREFQIPTCWLGLEASRHGASPILWTCGSGVVGGGGGGSVLPLGGQDVHGQRR